MVAFFAWVPVLFLMTVLQNLIPGMLSLHWLSLELSLLFVIYAGLYMSFFKGAALTLLAGFLVSTLTGTVTGLFMFVYVVMHGFAYLVSNRVYIEEPFFIILFTVLCAVLEGMMLVLINRYLLGAPAFYTTLQAMLPQVLILGLGSPLFFRACRNFEVLVHAQVVQPR